MDGSVKRAWERILSKAERNPLKDTTERINSIIMPQEKWDFINGLIVLARFIQVLGFFFAILMLLKEFPVGYTFAVFGVNLVGFFAILTGILTGFLSVVGVLVADALIIILSLFIFLRAYRIKRERDRFPPPPKPFTRCPVCGCFINPMSDYCALMDSKSLLYFDSKEHMEAFLGKPESYKISKEINYDGVRKICLKKEEGWINWGQSPQGKATL